VACLSEITLRVPQEILFDLKTNERLFSNYVRGFIAMDLYKNKNISLGYCAQLAEMPKEDFIKFLGLNNMSIFDFEDEKDFLEESDNALRYSEHKPHNSPK
jgi:predicted HTH domain antitoxin